VLKTFLVVNIIPLQLYITLHHITLATPSPTSAIYLPNKQKWPVDRERGGIFQEEAGSKPEVGHLHPQESSFTGSNEHDCFAPPKCSRCWETWTHSTRGQSGGTTITPPLSPAFFSSIIMIQRAECYQQFHVRAFLCPPVTFKGLDPIFM